MQPPRKSRPCLCDLFVQNDVFPFQPPILEKIGEVFSRIFRTRYHVHIAFRFRISSLLPLKFIVLGNTYQVPNLSPNLFSWQIIHLCAINPPTRFSSVRYHKRGKLFLIEPFLGIEFKCYDLLKLSVNCSTWTTPSNPGRSPLRICAFSPSGSPREETITSPAFTSSFSV